MMNPIRSIIQAELEKSREAEKAKARRKKRSSKKKRAAGIGAGAITGGMLGMPVGFMGAVAAGLGKKKIRINPPKGAIAQMKYFRGGGFQRDIAKGLSKAQREAMIGLGAGAGGGALIGGLAGHEISKHAARAVSSRITPQSSSVRGFSYDPKSQNMLVTFKNGGTYRYKGVPPNVARAMGRNKSVGKTVHRSIKKGGYQYEKVAKKKKQKSYTCKFCKEPATKGVIWAEGRGIVPCCDKHLAKGKVSIDDPKDIDLIRDLTKTSSAADAQRAFYASTKISPYYAKKQRDKRKAAEAKRMRKQAEEPIMIEVPPHEPLPDETPISSRVFENLTAQAKTLPEEAMASQGELVMDKMAQRRRSIAKMAGACKKQMTWQGLTMKFEYLDGEERSGVNKEGKKWSRTMKGCYGYMPGTYGKGADGEAIDVYFSPRAGDETAKSVYKIRQLRKDDGKFDEDKFMVGYASSADAKKAFLSNMPKWAFGDITEMSMNSFKTLVGQDQKKRKKA